MRRLGQFPFHPFLFSLYPPLVLIARNIDQVKPSAMGRAVLVVLTLCTILFLLLRLLSKDWSKAGAATTWLLALFFTYGHVYIYLEKNPIFGIAIGRHRILLPLWIILLGLGFWLLYKKIKDIHNVTVTLNLICALLVAFPLVKWISFEVSTARIIAQSPKNNPASENSSFDSANYPDIYYIVLDAYGRHDAILKKFKYDDTPFLNSLKEMGFYVTNCSQSNYSQTPLSMVSTLNLSYLTDLSPIFQTGKTYTKEIWPFLRNSQVQQELKKRGYQIVAFETGYWFTSFDAADVYYSQSKQGMTQIEKFEPINGVEALLIQTTGGILFADIVSFFSSNTGLDAIGPKIIQRNQILYILSKLPEIPVVVPRPKFVFTHIINPHFPFVFGPNGEMVSYRNFHSNDWLVGYPQQAEYIGKRITNIVREIIQLSATPPIIIIQGDHGYDFAKPQDRLLILNAYYLPGGGDSLLYPTISPVNTFRVVFSHYFGMDLPLLEDKSFYSANWDQAYNFQPMPYGLADCAK